MKAVICMFWQNFTQLCAQAGKPPSRAVEEMGFQKSAVTGWKRGVVPRDSTFDRLAYYFGVPVETLIADEPPTLTALASASPAPTSAPPTALAPDEAQLLTDYRGFSYAGRGLIRDFIEKMKAAGIYAYGVDPFLVGFNSDTQ